MGELLTIWLALLVALIAFTMPRRLEGGALTLAYFLGLSLIHVPGALVYLNPSSGALGREETEVGFQVTLIGMAAFLVGAVAARLIGRRRTTAPTALLRAQTEGLEQLGWRALVVGLIAYFGLLPVASRIPSLTSVASAFPTLLILGLWLRLYGAALVDNRRRTLETLLLLPLLPLSTLVGGGFLGFGIYWVLSILAFQFVITRRRVWFYLGAPLVVVMGLSLFVSYMGQRTGIRDVVWQQRASLIDRLERTSTIATNFEILDLGNPVHSAAINSRLNQNFLVGAGVIRHRDGATGLKYGGTVAPWALIPRAIWPGKPQVGGGGEVVSEFTGMDFAAGTSVGAGQPLEFYMNFGMTGIIIGFLALGFVLMRLDLGIMRSLGRGNMRGFMLRAMPGLCLLQPGGNLLEILVSVVAAIVAANVVLRLRILDAPWLRRMSARRSAPSVRPPRSLPSA